MPGKLRGTNQTNVYRPLEISLSAVSVDETLPTFWSIDLYKLECLSINTLFLLILISYYVYTGDFFFHVERRVENGYFNSQQCFGGFLFMSIYIYNVGRANNVNQIVFSWYSSEGDVFIQGRYQIQFSSDLGTAKSFY